MTEEKIHTKKYLPTFFDADVFIRFAAEELKKILPYQEELLSIKSSQANEIAPVDTDFQFIRSASILRKMSRYHKPLGIARMSTLYQAKKRRGSKPPKSIRGSRWLLRHLVMNLEQAGLVQQSEDPKHKGRVLSPKGQAFMDSCVKVLMSRSADSETKLAN